MESVKVKEYMNHKPVCFKAHETVVEAVERFLQSHSTGGPVINDNREVIGFISEQDCLKAMLSVTYHSGEVSKSVEELMRTDVLTIKPYDSVLRLAEDMSGNKPKIYPVVDDDNRLVGSINRTNVLQALDIHLHSVFEESHGYA